MTKLSRKIGLLKGFTLPEVIIAISVLSMVLATATGILVSIIRTNSENLSKIVAYGLAQEGIEAVRNVRDSDWILGLDFSGVKGSFNSPWGAKLYDIAPKYFTLELKSNDQGCVSASEVVNCVPFKLNYLEGFEEESWQNVSGVKIYKQEEAPFYFQGSQSTGSQIESRFSRYLKIEQLDSSKEIIRVSSVVKYLDDNGNDAEVVLTTDLSNWNS
jgi:prepilin-type N-terminal cleavage/methylation domain-containing protein